ncbi:unnamed protein product [Lampetra fluviatilis]
MDRTEKPFRHLGKNCATRGGGHLNCFRTPPIHTSDAAFPHALCYRDQWSETLKKVCGASCRNGGSRAARPANSFSRCGFRAARKGAERRPAESPACRVATP